MNYDFNLDSPNGQQDFKNWVSRTIKNEVNAYSRQVLALSNTTNSSNASISSSSVSPTNNTLVPSGVIVPFAGNNIPTGWLLCNGQTIDRNSYSSLFNAFTTSFPAGILNGTTTVSGLSGMVSNDHVGWGIAGSGIPAGAIISSVTNATTVIISAAATQSITTGIVISPYGFSNANNTTSFNLPDFQGRSLYGKGTSTELITLGKNDGLALASRTPVHTHSLNAHTHTMGNHTHGAGGLYAFWIAGGGIMYWQQSGAGVAWNSNLYAGVGGNVGGGGTFSNGIQIGNSTAGPSTNTTDGPSVASTGNGNPSYITVNYIIKI